MSDDRSCPKYGPGTLTNKLSLNISKTNFMLFTKCRNIPSFNVLIQQNVINRVSVT